MKKIMTLMIMAALMTAALTSCGQVAEPETGSVGFSETAAAEDETTPPEESIAETEPPVETSAPEEESQPEETTTSAAVTTEPPSTEPTISYHEWLLQSISFDSYFGDQEFHDLAYNMGLANAYDEGKAYAIVPESGGAGHVYYNVYYTDDYGSSWAEGEFYDELNGENKHFALEDGGIMLFSLHSARAETYPIVSYLYFDGMGIRAVELKEYLSQTVLSDGRLLSEADNIEYEITYRYDYVFNITITDSESGEMLCGEQDFDLQWAAAYALENEFTEPME